MRYRLWDMGLLVNRAIVYGALTAMVATSFPSWAWSVSAVSSPAGSAMIMQRFTYCGDRSRTRARVPASAPTTTGRGRSRRFYREKYDADRAVDHSPGSSRIWWMPNRSPMPSTRCCVTPFTPTDSWIVLDDAIPVFHPEPRTCRSDGSQSRGARHHRELWPDGAVLTIPLVAQGRTVKALFSDHGVRVGATAALDRRTLGKDCGGGCPAVRVGQLVQAQERQALEKGPASTARWRWRERFSATCCRNSFRRLQAGDSPPATSRREVGGDYM